MPSEAALSMIRMSPTDQQQRLGERLNDLYGCPRAKGYPCQGDGDFGAHDVVTHCPAMCWV